VTGFWEQAREFQAANGDVRKALQKQSPQLVGRGQWVEAASGAVVLDRDAQNGWRCSSNNKSGMTDAEKLKATDVVAGSMLAVAKLELAAMAQTKQALY